MSNRSSGVTGLLRAHADEPALRVLVGAHDHKTMFNAAWDDVGHRFLRLRNFVGGLASAFANTSTIESDFSILKWEMDEFRSSMTNLSLKGIFQSKQHELLLGMPAFLDP